MFLDDFWTKTMPALACEGVRGCGFGVLEVNYYDKRKIIILKMLSIFFDFFEVENFWSDILGEKDPMF